MTSPSAAPSAWVLTGLSGAGKHTALRALEAAGVACVDNLPPGLLGAFAAAGNGAVAVVDSRRAGELPSVIDVGGLRVLFLDADDSVLVRRLADSTRPHPCALAGAGLAAVTAERGVMAPLRAAAESVIDTSRLSPADLGARVVATVTGGAAPVSELTCTVSSFGFKYGPQPEADWLIDSRVLPNPFWDPALRPLTGLDAPVREFLLTREETGQLLDRSESLLAWAAVEARGRGRRAMHVAVGCTGGRHRSVVVATELARRLGDAGVSVDVRHRDVGRPDPR